MFRAVHRNEHGKFKIRIILFAPVGDDDTTGSGRKYIGQGLDMLDRLVITDVPVASIGRILDLVNRCIGPHLCKRSAPQILAVKIGAADIAWIGVGVDYRGMVFIDRKSTRLNSSHVRISYAVFCLKKKKKTKNKATEH